MSGLFELSKILIAMSNMDGTHSVNKAFVRSIYDSVYYSEQRASFEDVLHVASSMGLLHMRDNQVRLSDAGRMFIELMSMDGDSVMLNSNDEQKRFMRSSLNATRISNVCGPIFKKFRANYVDKPPVWNAYAHAFNSREIYMLKVLEEIGIVHNRRGLIVVDSCHTDLFSRIKNTVHVDMAIIEARKNEVGAAGEDLTMKYEIKRLKGYADLADRVQQVSIMDPHAGYDIASFDGPLSDEGFDRFIEVKATNGIRPKFFWSSNEVKKAREYGNAYWIYLWTDVYNSKTLHLIQNPYVKMFESGDPKPKPVSYFVDESLFDMRAAGRTT